METEEQIKKFKDFIEEKYLPVLLDSARKGKNFLVIEFNELSKFDPELSNQLLDEPEETIKAAEKSIEQFDLEKEKPNFRVRFKSIPDSQKIMIRNIRSSHIGRLLVMEGIVRQKSDVRPKVSSARFECPACGNIISVLQLDDIFKEPSNCGCGRKGKFRLLSKELLDAQSLVLEESPESLEGGEQPKRMTVFLKDDLVSPMSEKKTSPGSKISVVGIIKDVPLILRSGGKSTTFDLLIEANFVDALEETFLEVEISEEEERKIREIAEDPKVYQKLVASIAPSIYGYDKIKESFILQLMGGVRKIRKDRVVSRGDIHVLLVGDPGAGKSALLKRINLVAPKGRYISGKGISAAGLTASVVRDEFLKGWSLEAGAMVLSSNGICCIDELDKMSQEDTAAMHEAMENQTISISKANIQATLLARTTVLAAANPKFGRFDPHGIVAEQITLPPALINRFDLIFSIKDIPDESRDKEMANHILNLHQNPDSQEQEIPTELLKKYIAFARQKINPVLTDSALEEIKDYYIKMRSSSSSEEEREGRITIQISPRQLEALVRMSEASARVRLSDKVQKKDAKKAIELLEFCLTEVGFDKEAGRIDIDRIATGISATQRNLLITIKEIITELENKVKPVPIDSIVDEAKKRNINEEKVEETIEKLKREGDIFEPRMGFLQKI